MNTEHSTPRIPTPRIELPRTVKASLKQPEPNRRGWIMGSIATAAAAVVGTIILITSLPNDVADSNNPLLGELTKHAPESGQTSIDTIDYTPHVQHTPTAIQPKPRPSTPNPSIAPSGKITNKRSNSTESDTTRSINYIPVTATVDLLVNQIEDTELPKPIIMAEHTGISSEEAATTDQPLPTKELDSKSLLDSILESHMQEPPQPERIAFKAPKVKQYFEDMGQNIAKSFRDRPRPFTALAENIKSSLGKESE